MHGLVFEIFEQFIIEKHSLDAWHAIKKRANCEIEDKSFVTRTFYNYDIWVNLLNGAAQELKVTFDEVLQAYGHYNIRYHFDNGYASLLKCQGTTLRQWLSNLNAMHDHIQKSFPGENFCPPVFWCEDDSDHHHSQEGCILLHYYSQRGNLLVPWVVGIVSELASYHFEVEIQMKQLSLQDQDGASFTTWRISAMDETQNWKLSPSVAGQQTNTRASSVDFGSIPLPGKCPFTGRKLKKSSIAETTPSKASKKCPIDHHQLSESSNSVTSNHSDDNDEGEEIGLTESRMKEIFPFHVLVDQEFRISQVGIKLPTLLGVKAKDFVGHHIQEFLEITKPVMATSWDWKTLNKLSDQNFFLSPINAKETTTTNKGHRKTVSMKEDSTMKFKGSMIQIGKQKVLFDLSPEARNVTELNNMGLTLSDLPLQSCQRDAVFLGEYVTQEADKAHKLDKLSRNLAVEKQLSNTLLHSIIPHKVAEDLRNGKTVEPTLHKNVTLFFSDVVGFTNICDQVEPWDVIDMMNQLYSVMDFLASHFDLYKVETVGDSYMCCSGLPEPDELHAEKVANFSLAVLECVKHVKSPIDGSPIQLRIGIHTGSCTSGVVGTMTPHYCLFGDMVNTASRHESTGLPGKIHCSCLLFGLLKHYSKSESYEFKARGLVDMKGKGEHYTYWLEKATETNPWANQKALAELSTKVEEMLASKTWKMRRYFRKGHLIQDAVSINGLSSATNSSGLGSMEDSHSRSDCSSRNTLESGADELSVNSDDSDLEGDIEDDDNSGPIIEFTEEQLLHFGKDWEELKWEHGLTQAGLANKIADVIISCLKSCLKKEGPRMKIVEDQLRQYVVQIADMYNADNPYRNFFEAGAVFLRAVWFWENLNRDEDRGPVYGLGYDPWDRFVLLFSALVHNVYCDGVSNSQLEAEDHIVHQLYKGKNSYQQRKSFATALEVLEEDFGDLHEEITYGCPTFRSSVRKAILSTDIESKDKLQDLLHTCEEQNTKVCHDEKAAKAKNESNVCLLLAMASLGHYTQGFDLFLSFNRLHFEEQTLAHKVGRGEDKRESWYSEQTVFFEDCIMPLVKQVQQILPEATYLEEGAMTNVDLWRENGKEWLAASMLPGAKVQDFLGGQASGDPMEKLIAANVNILESLLRQVMSSRDDNRKLQHFDQHPSPSKRASNPRDEIQLAIQMRKSITSSSNKELSPELMTKVKLELRDFVVTVAAGYENNRFHNFLHCSHVTHLANLLVKGIHPITEASKDAGDIAHDPLARFAIVFSALVHDVGHTGVPNNQLAEEDPELAEKYQNKSIAEQNSIDTAWEILMSRRFQNLHQCLFESRQERDRFRQLLVNCVMATDIFDQDLRALRRERWEKAFSEDGSLSSGEEEGHYKATIVIEHIMQASDVAHTMQEWEIYRQWNESLFREMHEAYSSGRAEKDPSEGWYQGELWFFDNWVIPLAQNLKECGVLDIVSDQLVKQARSNRAKWELEGEEICRNLLRSKPTLQRWGSNMSGQASVASAGSAGTEAILTSHYVSEIESLSRMVKRYERKMEAAVGNLIAVAYKGNKSAKELRKQSWSDVHQHFKQQDWYRVFSDDEDEDLASNDGSTDMSLGRQGKTVQFTAEASLTDRDSVITHLSIAESIVNDEKSQEN